MTSKINAKTILFSALIFSMIIPIYGMNNVADAATAEDQATTADLVQRNSAQWNDNMPDYVKAYKETGLDAKQVRQNLENTNKFSFEFKGQSYDLNLYEFDLRAPDAKAFIRDAQGNMVEVEKEDIKTYQGYVDGDKSKSVFLLVSENDVAGFVKNGDSEITIEPLRNYDDASEATKHIIYEAKIATLDNVREQVIPVSSLQQLILPEAEAANDYLMRVVMDCDRQYYLLGTGNWQSRLLTLMGGITADYATETSIGISVEATVCDTAGTEYTSTNHHTLWDQVRDEWDGSSSYTNRHTVVMITGKDMSGCTIGIVEPDYSPPVSNKDKGSYAIVQAVNDSCSVYGGSPQEEKQELMHEMGGHIMGATHNAASSFTCGSDTCWTIMKPLIDVGSYSLRSMTFSTTNESTIDTHAQSYLE
ncbi:MAG: hypothetical protein J4F36_01285 [Nitrosopumilaceae archaeon]|nr:hypothetical protein [Nitrosopumilaceae archaeon]